MAHMTCQNNIAPRNVCERVLQKQSAHACSRRMAVSLFAATDYTDALQQLQHNKASATVRVHCQEPALHLQPQ